MEEERYKITVALPCWGRPFWAKVQIYSITHQTMDGWEAFIIGDGCPLFEKFILKDRDILTWIEESRDRGNRIVFENQRHLGGFGYGVMNRAREECNSEYFIFANDDDFLYPSHFENYYQSIVGRDLDLVLKTTILPNREIRIPEARHGGVGHSEMLVRSSFLKKAIPHNDNYNSDWQVLFSLLSQEPRWYIDGSGDATYWVRYIHGEDWDGLRNFDRADTEFVIKMYECLKNDGLGFDKVKDDILDSLSKEREVYSDHLPSPLPNEERRNSSYGNVLVSYCYIERPEAVKNLQFFIDNGLSDEITYCFVIQGYVCSVDIPNMSNVYAIKRANIGFDFGAHRATLDNFDLHDFDYFVFMNCGVVGPFLPAYYPKDYGWWKAFTDKINNHVKLVGTSIIRRRDEAFPAVEGFFFVVDRIGLNAILENGKVFVDHPTKKEAVQIGEWGITEEITKRGFGIDCLLYRYQGLDWSDESNWKKDYPSRGGSYDGESISPFEVMFHKPLWHGETSFDETRVNTRLTNKYVKWNAERNSPKGVSRICNNDIDSRRIAVLISTRNFRDDFIRKMEIFLSIASKVYIYKSGEPAEGWEEKMEEICQQNSLASTSLIEYLDFNLDDGESTSTLEKNWSLSKIEMEGYEWVWLGDTDCNYGVGLNWEKAWEWFLQVTDENEGLDGSTHEGKPVIFRTSMRFGEEGNFVAIPHEAFLDKKKPDEVAINGKILVCYCYIEREDATDNLRFFLENAIYEDVTYCFVIQGYQCSVSIPNLPNIHIIRRENKGFDFGSYKASLDYFDSRDDFDYFVFMNCGVLGPFMHSGIGGNCFEPFVNKINDRVKLVGTSIAMSKYHRNDCHPYVESFFFVVDGIGLAQISEVFSSEFTEPSQAVMGGEVEMSKLVLDSGYDIDCMLYRYQGRDWRNASRSHAMPALEGGYDGTSVSPLEVIFHKPYWRNAAGGDPNYCNKEMVNKYLKWTDGRAPIRLSGVGRREDLGLYLECHHPRGIGVEVGTQGGGYSEVLLKQWISGTIYSVDRWQYVDGYIDVANFPQEEHDKIYEEAKNTLSKYGDRSIIMKMDSVEASGKFEDGSLDFVYIDADHSYNECLADLKAWYPKLRNGGLIAGHAFLDGEFPTAIFGVESALRDFFKEDFNKIVRIPHDIEGTDSWAIIKEVNDE